MDKLNSLTLFFIYKKKKKRTINTIIYFLPYIALAMALKCLDVFSWYLGLPLAVSCLIGMHVSIVKYLIPIPHNEALWKTPYFSCIFQASAFWVLVTWTCILVPSKLCVCLSKLSHSSIVLSTKRYCLYDSDSFDLHGQLLHCNVSLLSSSHGRPWIRQQ